MGVIFNQNNNNYGSGTQNIHQYNYSSNSEYNELNKLVEELKERKSYIPQEISKEVDELIDVVQNTPQEEMKKPIFIFRFTQLLTIISSALPKIVNSTEDIGNLITNIENIMKVLWK